MTPSELLVPHFGVRKDVDWVFDRTVDLVKLWVDKVKVLWKEGKSLDEVSALMEEDVGRDAGVEELAIYAKVSIRTSVMGIMHYFDKNP